MTGGRLYPLRRIEGRTDELSDEALVAAAATGDAAAVGALVDRFQQPVYRFVARLLGSDSSDRDDIVQQTFIELMRAASRFREGSTVRVWIFGIAANISRNQIRTIVRRRRLEAGLASIPAPPSVAPDAPLERRELLAKLQAGLEELPHALREAFVMCDLEEISGRDAANALGVRQGTVWRRVHEARRALRLFVNGGES
jgi:RNA polymerase sigma-70 factor, ECF subfamily